VIVVALCIMTNECELIVEYDMVVRLGKGHGVLIFGM